NLPSLPQSTLSPYTTLFRSDGHRAEIDIRKSRALWHKVIYPTHQPHERSIRSEGGIECLLNLLDDIHTATPSSAIISIIVRLARSEEHTSELQSRENLVCRL